MEEKKLTTALLMRLPVYLDYLRALPADGPESVSASSMAKDLGLNDVLVRKDLAVISGGGRRRVGHLRRKMIEDIERLLDYGTTCNAILVGTGKLGQALLTSEEFEPYGTRILAGFDLTSEQEQELEGKPILPLDQMEVFCSRRSIHMGIITAPPETAQTACDRLVGCGINVIWNFAATLLRVPSHVIVQNLNLAASLAALRMQQYQRMQLQSNPPALS